MYSRDHIFAAKLLNTGNVMARPTRYLSYGMSVGSLTSSSTSSSRASAFSFSSIYKQTRNKSNIKNKTLKSWIHGPVVFCKEVLSGLMFAVRFLHHIVVPRDSS